LPDVFRAGQCDGGVGNDLIGTNPLRNTVEGFRPRAGGQAKVVVAALRADEVGIHCQKFRVRFRSDAGACEGNPVSIAGTPRNGKSPANRLSRNSCQCPVERIELDGKRVGVAVRKVRERQGPGVQPTAGQNRRNSERGKALYERFHFNILLKFVVQYKVVIFDEPE
jgi:hypothetical protein